jgi:hypothetical protein
MGMDVYGSNPKSDIGKIFRRNVWGWHSMWEYVEHEYPDIATKVKGAHTNDGGYLEESDCIDLSNRIDIDFKIGKIHAYIYECSKFLDSLSDVDCYACLGFGVTRSGVFHPSEGVCRQCQGKGKARPYAYNYMPRIDDLVEFSMFLKSCGGFKIF